MKEMRLFEVGLKDKATDTSYYNKVNVGASDAEEAIAKARLHVVEITNYWWESGGREDMIFSAFTDDKDASEMTDTQIQSSEKYQQVAQKDFDDEMERVKNLKIGKVLDIGTLIV